MKLYSTTELASTFSGQLELTGLATHSSLTLTIDDFGECLTTFTPVKFKESGITDTLVALYPKELFWLSEPLYHVFLSEINQ